MIKTYTAAEASEVLHVSVQTVIRYIRHGRLRASRIVRITSSRPGTSRASSALPR